MPRNLAPPGQQPLQRIVGRRKNPPLGSLPSRAARAAMTASAGYRTRAPKGVFIYATPEAMQADRDRWTLEAVLARQRDRA